MIVQPVFELETFSLSLSEWNDTQADFPDVCIHELFTEQAERTPEAIAVVCPLGQLTYQELNTRANQLAHHLQSLGVGAEVPVGICVERSWEMLVGILGILKAGGAYVPLDPTYPLERLSLMLEDAQVPVLLTQDILLGRLPNSWAQVISLDGDWQAIAQFPTDNPESDISPDNLAYVVYTSGSTGQPKGVEILHAGLVNLVTWHHQTYNITPADRATQIASPAFDAAVWEIWPYLTAGASLHIPNVQTRTSLSLWQWLADEAMTICFLPTPLAETLFLSPLPSNLKLRFLLTGGDRLHQLPQQFPFTVVNHYGPTENTVVTTSFVITDTTTDAPPIGRPIANTQIYILDEYLQPVAIGEPGELHISGIGLARGYRHLAELTAEKFIPHPFSPEKGMRLYKTGDQVRYLSDGDLEFIGRIDDQVKIRGFRIELGEIEAVLTQHSAIQQSVVIVREDIPGDRRLVAYVNQLPPALLSDLRSFLESKLPDYMIPDKFVCLDALPLTPNGKVDRRALPAPETTLLKIFTPPETSLELVIAEIWKEVLGAEQVGKNDNFFELGGHSLLAMQVLMEIYEAFGVDLQLSVFFENSTLTEFAGAIALSHHNPETVEKTAQLLLQLTALSEAEVEERMKHIQEIS